MKPYLTDKAWSHVLFSFILNSFSNVLTVRSPDQSYFIFPRVSRSRPLFRPWRIWLRSLVAWSAKNPIDICMTSPAHCGWRTTSEKYTHTHVGCYALTKVYCQCLVMHDFCKLVFQPSLFSDKTIQLFLSFIDLKIFIWYKMHRI